MPTICQTVFGNAQFTGLAGAGLFEFAQFDRLPRSTRIVIHTISYHSAIPANGGTGGDRVDMFMDRPPGGSQPTEAILLARGLAPAIVGPDGDSDLTICERVLCRDPGDNGRQWRIIVTSEGKDLNASVCVDFDVVPYPETSTHDSAL